MSVSLVCLYWKEWLCCWLGLAVVGCFGGSCFAQVWQPLKASGSRIVCSADGTRVMTLDQDPIFGGTGLPYFSSDSGQAWTDPPVGGQYVSDIASSADGAQWFFPFQVGGIQLSYSPVIGWVALTKRTNVMGSLAASSADGRRLATAGLGPNNSFPTGILVSKDSGFSWQTALPQVEVTSLALSADGGTIAAATPMNWIYVSRDFGTSWSTNTVDAQWSGTWNSVASSADGTRLFAASNDGLFLSPNAGHAWMRLLNAGALQSVNVSADGTQLAVGASNAVVYTSTNSGTTWSRWELGDTNAPTTAVAMSADGSRVYAAPEFYSVYALNSTPPAPTLQISVGLTNLDVFWPYPSSKFILQTAADPTTNFWTDVPTAPVLNLSNLQNQVSLPKPSQPAFFRLASFQSFESGFQDLDFESGTLVSTNGFYPVSVAFSAAFPGWTVYLGSNKVDVAGYNAYPLDSAAISLETNADLTMDGKYWAGLFAGIDAAQNPPKVSASLAQTGFIPSGARSMVFKAQWFNSGQPAPVITMNSQALAIRPLGGNLFGTDISSFAGTTAELRFTVLPAQPPLQAINALYLDSISFSSQSVP